MSDKTDDGDTSPVTDLEANHDPKHPHLNQGEAPPVYQPPADPEAGEADGLLLDDAEAFAEPANQEDIVAGTTFDLGKERKQTPAMGFMSVQQINPAICMH